MRATRPSFRSGPTAVAVWGAWQEESVRDGPRAAAYQSGPFSSTSFY